MVFPENYKDRENFVFEQVLAGNFEAEWTPLEYTIEGKLVKLNVMKDALKIDGIRVNVSAQFQQKLADVFDASLLTAQVVDLMYIHASKRIDPQPMPIASTVAAMVKHSQNVDRAIGSATVNGLVAPVGKHWILDKKLESMPNRACTYGWHFVGTTMKGIKGYSVASQYNQNFPKAQSNSVIQQNTCGHDMWHLDYSQTCQLVSQTCWVDGAEKRFSDLLQDPILNNLVTHAGALNIIRQPGTTPFVGTNVLFPVKIIVDSTNGAT